MPKMALDKAVYTKRRALVLTTRLSRLINISIFLKTKLNSGEGPDLFGGQSGKTDLIVNYDVEKNAVDLSGEPWTKTGGPQVLDQSTLNGKVYGQTVWNTLGTTWVVNYNKDIFSKLNLSVPTTFADFKSDCQKIMATGVIPLYEPMADGWHQVLWFAELGVQIENLAPGNGRPVERQ